MAPTRFNAKMAATANTIVQVKGCMSHANLQHIFIAIRGPILTYFSYSIHYTYFCVMTSTVVVVMQLSHVKYY